MSQRARALVERLKRESSHLPGNTPAQNKAIETICQILDELVEPAAAAPEPEPAAEESVESAPEAAGEPEQAEATEESAEPAEAEESEEEAEESPSGMTTQNSPT